MSTNTQQHSHNRRYPDWREDVFAGDIVAFRWSDANNNKKQSAKIHPCLLLGVYILEDGYYAALTCGAERINQWARHDAIKITDAKDLAAAGLSKPIVFDCTDRSIVSIDHQCFETMSNGSAIFGRLIDTNRQRFQRLMTQFRIRKDWEACQAASRQRAVTLEREPNAPHSLFTPRPYNYDTSAEAELARLEREESLL